jgi:ABC-2 type transport system permease protein
MVGWLLTLMIQLYLLRVVWSAVYDGRESVDGIPADTLLVYLTISSLHRFFLPNSIAFEIEERINTGRVATDLIRPFGFMHQMIAIQAGSLAGSLPLLVVVVPVAMLVGSLTLPSPSNLLVYLLSLALAFVVNVVIWMLVGMLGFWMMNVSGVCAMLSISSDFLAGALVPLWFMPETLRTVVEWLPFQATMFLPASIFAGQVSGSDVIQPLIVQVVWIGVLIVIANAVWIRAQRKLVIQGG